ncbi:Porphobilinogen deaminase, partial [Dissostichus eleginoides]
VSVGVFTILRSNALLRNLKQVIPVTNLFGDMESRVSGERVLLCTIWTEVCESCAVSLT